MVVFRCILVAGGREGNRPFVVCGDGDRDHDCDGDDTIVLVVIGDVPPREASMPDGENDKLYIPISVIMGMEWCDMAWHGTVHPIVLYGRLVRLYPLRYGAVHGMTLFHDMM